MEMMELKRKINAQSERIDKLCRRTGNQGLTLDVIPDDLRKSVLSLKQHGQKATAIKKVREATAWDLVRAKKYVELL